MPSQITWIKLASQVIQYLMNIFLTNKYIPNFDEDN